MFVGMPNSHDVTLLLSALTRGDEDDGEKLIPLVYVELRRLARSYMRRERTDHTLQATALVHEAYLKLVEQRSANWQSRAHFFGVAAQVVELRFFVGLSVEEAAAVLGISPKTVKRDWSVAKAWLYAELKEHHGID